MGFLDDLFLGSGPKLETRSLPTTTPEQQQALRDLLARLNLPPEAFTGNMSAGLSGLENASLGALEERSRALAQPDANLEAAGTSIRDQLDFNKQTGNANDYFTNAVQNPALDSFQREVLPQISRQFGGNDFFSTERQSAEGLARRDLLSSLTAERSRVNLDEFDKARERALTAAGIAPVLTQAENQRTQTQMDILRAAGVKRQVEQDALDRTYNEFVRQQQQRSHNQDQLAQAALTPTIENIGMTDPGNAGLIPSLLGAIAAGAGGQLGQSLGGALSGGIQRLFGRSDPTATSDAASGAASTVGAGAATAGAGVAGAGGAVPGAAGAAVPGGAVTITDAAGGVIPSIPFAGGAGIPGLVAGSQAGIGAGIAGTEAANAAALGSLTAPSIGAGGAATAGGVGGAAAGGGGGAAAGGAAAGASGLGLAAGLGVAALPALIMALGGFGNDRTARNALALQQSGLQQTQLAGGTRVLILPDGSFTPFDENVMDAIRERWGVMPKEQFYQWVQTLPKVPGNVRRIVAPGRNPGRTPGTQQ